MTRIKDKFLFLLLSCEDILNATKSVLARSKPPENEMTAEPDMRLTSIDEFGRGNSH